MINDNEIKNFVEKANLPGSYPRPHHPTSNKKLQVLEYVREFRDNSLFSNEGDYKPFIYYNSCRAFGDKKNSPYFAFKKHEEKYDIKREWRLIAQNFVSTVYVASAVKTKSKNHDELFINASSKFYTWTKNQVFKTSLNLHLVNKYGEFRDLNQLSLALILNNDEITINNLIKNLKNDYAIISKIPVKRIINGQEIDATELNFSMNGYKYNDNKYPYVTKSYIVHKALTRQLLGFIDNSTPTILLQSNGDFLNALTSNPEYFRCRRGENVAKDYLLKEIINRQDDTKRSPTLLPNKSDVAEGITKTVKIRKYNKRQDTSEEMIEFLKHFVDKEVITKNATRRTYFYFNCPNKNKHQPSVFTAIAPMLKNKDADIKDIFRINKHTGWYSWGVTADNKDSDRVARVLPYVYNNIKDNDSFITIHNLHYVDENGKLQSCDTAPFALLEADEKDEETIFLKKILERKTQLNITLRPWEKNIDGEYKVGTEFCFSLYDLPTTQKLNIVGYDNKYQTYNRKMFSLMQEFCDPTISLKQLQADGSFVDPNTSNEGYLLSK